MLLLSLSNPRAITSELCSMLPWVTATPRGRLVEPDVYCRKATVSRAAAGFLHLSASAEEIASLAIISGNMPPIASFQAVLKTGTMSAVVIMVLHWASLSNSQIFGRDCFNRPRWAGYVVTAIAPA